MLWQTIICRVAFLTALRSAAVKQQLIGPDGYGFEYFQEKKYNWFSPLERQLLGAGILKEKPRPGLMNKLDGLISRSWSKGGWVVSLLNAETGSSIPINNVTNCVEKPKNKKRRGGGESGGTEVAHSLFL